MISKAHSMLGGFGPRRPGRSALWRRASSTRAGSTPSSGSRPRHRRWRGEPLVTHGVAPVGAGPPGPVRAGGRSDRFQGRRQSASWCGYLHSVGGTNVSLMTRGDTQRSMFNSEPALSLVPLILAPPNGC